MTVGFSSVIIGLALVYVDCAKEDIGFVVSWSVSYFSIFFLSDFKTVFNFLVSAEMFPKRVIFFLIPKIEILISILVTTESDGRPVHINIFNVVSDTSML